ncbi:MAG TPA: sulfite exporter TauE/SafE family protein [Actinomycetota bacterium]|nr:sulfite exporter TauE/SafE family protein [Actinomycetota bacterium]
MALEVGAGLVVGVVSAFFGVGGGTLLVPFMVLVLGFGQHLAEGTSLAVIIPTAVVGAAAHMGRGYVSLRHGLTLGAGGVFGSFLGVGLALHLDAPTLQSLFGISMVLLGSHLVVQGVRDR